MAAALLMGLGAVALWRGAAGPAAEKAVPTTGSDRPVEEVVTVVPRAPVDPGPAPVEEVVTIVPGATPPPPPPAERPPEPVRTARDGTAPAPTPDRPAEPEATPPATATADASGSRPVLSLRREPAGEAPSPPAPAPTRVAAARPSTPAAPPPSLPPATAPGPPRITQPPAPVAPPAARGRIETGRTRLTSGREADGPKGFDMSGLEAERSTELVGRLEFEIEPSQPRPGEPYSVRIYLLNTGDKDVKLRSLTVTVLVNGRRTPNAVSPDLREVAAGQRGLIHTLSGTWEAGSWAVQAQLLTSRNEKAVASARWVSSS